MVATFADGYVSTVVCWTSDAARQFQARERARARRCIRRNAESPEEAEELLAMLGLRESDEAPPIRLVR